jgi:hypothetical protein
MPTVIDFPLPGDPFGVGFLWQAHTTTTGPFGFSVWRAEIFETGGEVARLRSEVGVSDPHVGLAQPFTNTLWLGNGTWQQWPKLATGQTATLRVALRVGGTEVESASQSITSNVTDGGNAYLGDQIKATQQQLTVLQNAVNSQSTTAIPAIQSGITAMQTDVTSILTSILGGIPGFTGQIINNIIGQPAPGLVTRELIGDFTGCGALTRTAFGQPVDAFGLAWEVISLGGGVGIDTSVPQRFEPWLIDIEQRHKDHAGHEYTSGTARFDYSNGYWFFQPSLPSLINYCILPSVTLRLYWLLVTV